MSVIKITLLTFFSLLMGASSSTYTTRYEVGPGRSMRDFVQTGTGAATQSKTKYYVIDMPLLLPATATGSNTVTSTGPDGNAGTKYSALCVPNPLTKLRNGTGSGNTANMSRGSGGILTAILGVKENPNAAGGDIGFVKACESGTGSQLFNDTCTATGCINKFFANGSTWVDWNGADFLKWGLRKDPTKAFDANLFLLITDNPAE